MAAGSVKATVMAAARAAGAAATAVAAFLCVLRPRRPQGRRAESGSIASS
eukprot:CAMPEP_0185433024 /NCGR_PEP_ID=MMETSP1365-20130426/20748_1 /TAXON_ID=38817 /ORGANISM="Gephyrocapsa oceanica, Strain RCC1303" /LENGTH=49 /DNA_ID= /DNA_START= /DNA_END= /DNA_ORIENTATION=